MEIINITLWSLSLVAFLAYTSYILLKYGIQPSYSKSYYKLKYVPLFTLFMVWYTVPLTIISNAPLMYVAGLLITSVGAVGEFLGKDGIKNQEDNKLTYKLHMILSIGGVLLTFVAFAIEYNMWIQSLLSLILIILVHQGVIKIKNKIWWIEAYTMMYSLITLFIHKIL